MTTATARCSICLFRAMPRVVGRSAKASALGRTQAKVSKYPAVCRLGPDSNGRVGCTHVSSHMCVCGDTGDGGTASLVSPGWTHQGTGVVQAFTVHHAHGDVPHTVWTVPVKSERETYRAHWPARWLVGGHLPNGIRTTANQQASSVA